mgnify:CR=1 FL=1
MGHYATEMGYGESVSEETLKNRKKQEEKLKINTEMLRDMREKERQAKAKYAAEQILKRHREEGLDTFDFNIDIMIDVISDIQKSMFEDHWCKIRAQYL